MKNIIENFNAHPITHRIVFLLSLLIAFSPIFVFDWVITLDGPWHIYNAVVESRLLEGDPFSHSFFRHNPDVVSNYTTHFLLLGLLQLVKLSTALKLFHLIIGFVFVAGFLYWNQAFKHKGRLLSSSVVFIAVISLLFVSGFYNFILAIGILFLTLGYYEQKHSFDWKFYIRLVLLLGLIYFTHSLAFGLTGIFIGILILFKQKKKYSIKLKELTLLLMVGLPYIILTLFFMESRETQLWYIPKDQLLHDLINASGIYAREQVSKMALHLFVMISLIVVIVRLFLKHTKDKYLLVIAFFLLLLYFFTPDSFQFAGVFSIRYNLLFWLVLFAWIIRNPFNRGWINKVYVFFALVVLIFKTSDMFSFFKRLDNDAKELITVCEALPEHSVVIPVFASNIWEHFHIADIIGAEYNVLVLENNGARNDYFPIRYITNFEEQIKSNQSIDSSTIGVRVTHMIRIGQESVDFENDHLIYELSVKNGTCIRKSNQFELWEIQH